MHRAISSVAPLLATCALTGAIGAQAKVTVIGYEMPVDGVSADGSTAYGEHYVASRGYRWTPAGGTELLPAGGHSAVGISTDGSTVLGETDNPLLGSVLYAGTQWSNLGSIGPSCDAFSANPYDLSDDGSVAVGLGWDTCKTYAYRWTQATGMQGLPIIGNRNSRANVVSGFGLTTGGWDEADTGGRRAAVWWPDGTTSLPLVSPSNPDGYGEVWGISTYGTWVTGEGSNGTGAWRYSQPTGLVNLGTPPNSLPGTRARGVWVSTDGDTIYGSQGAVGAWRATVWKTGLGVQWLDVYLQQNYGVTIPQDVCISGASDDGRVIVGYQQAGPFILDSFYIELWPAPGPCGYTPYGESLGGANVLSLTGGGNPNVGGLADLETSGASAPFVITAGSLTQAQFPIFGGTALLDPTKLILQFVSATAGGNAVASLPIPPDAALAGAQLYFQSFSADAGQSQGFALSNGLELQICP